MATKEQYEIFKAIYDEETDRYADLRNTAKLFASICSFLIGALAFKVPALFLSQALYAKIIFAVAVGAFFIALLLLVKSLGISSYETMFSPRSVATRLATDDEFFEDRIADIVVANERNWATNRRRSRVIQIAMYAMFAGVTSTAVGVLLTVFLSES